MKKLVFGLIATVMFGTLSFGQNQNDYIAPEMYGVYHNELLKSYTDKYKNNEISNFIGLYDNLRKEFDILHPNVLTNEENKFYRDRLLDVIGSKTIMTNTNFKVLTTIALKKFYCLKTQTALINLLENPKAPEETINILNNLLKDKSMTSNDINEIKKLLSVYKASVQFWTNNSFPFGTSRKQCDPTHQVFFADLCGCMFGGVGSVAYSWGIYAIQQQHGGGCI